MEKKRVSEMRAKYRRVFSGDDGRDVLRHILKSAGVFTPTAHGESYQSLAWSEGQRSLALRIARAALTTKELDEEVEKEFEN
jgi:hypothetical protein